MSFMRNRELAEYTVNRRRQVVCDSSMKLSVLWQLRESNVKKQAPMQVNKLKAFESLDWVFRENVQKYNQ